MEVSNAVEAIIWDFDGTLLNSFDIFYSVLSVSTQMNNVAMPGRDVIALNYHGSLEHSIKSSLGLADGDLLDAVHEDFLEVQENYYDEPSDHLFPDALQLADTAARSGLRQFIITNRFHSGRGTASPRKIVAATQLNRLIDDIICGDETSVLKPDPAVAWPLLERYGLVPSSVLVIGDQHVDAELARNLGCQAVIVGREGQSSHLETIPNWQSFATSVTSLNAIRFGANG